MNKKLFKSISSFLLAGAMVCICTSTSTVFASENTTALESYNITSLQDGSVVETVKEDFTVITGENEHLFEYSDSFEDEIEMSYDEVNALYENYKASRLQLHSDATNIDNVDVEDFVQYSVDQGIIDDTPAQRNALTVAFYRAQFALVAAGGDLLGFDAAANLLSHSLQDDPENLNYSSSSSYSEQIADSEECQQIIDDFIDYVSGSSLSTRMTSGSTTLNSTTDLHLAYNKVSYVATGTKNLSTGKWTLNISFSDTYDFQEEAWENSMTNSDLVTIINNHAAGAQDAGAIVPYEVKLTVSTSFYE